MVQQISKRSRGEFEIEKDCCVFTCKDGEGKSKALPLCCCGHATAASRRRCLATTFAITLVLQVGAWWYFASGAASGSDGGAILEPAIAIGTIFVCGFIEVLVLIACAGVGFCCPVVPAPVPEPPLAPVALPN